MNEPDTSRLPPASARPTIPTTTRATPETPARPKRKTGVILAMDLDSDNKDLDVILTGLREDYPGVGFTIVAGAMSSVVFEYDE